MDMVNDIVWVFAGTTHYYEVGFTTMNKNE